jgi:hypothetical protein
MQMQNIDDVINAIAQIIRDCELHNNRAGYFAALYHRMTIAVKEGINNGAFEDGKRMEQLDICFADRYLTAQQCYNNKQLCSASWQFAFDSCLVESATVIQQLLLGINTHINLDLAIAAATVAPGNKIYNLENDFNHINNVIASLVDDVQNCLAQVWLPMRLLNKISNKQQQAVLNFSIDKARATAWANAVLLANMNEDQQQAYIVEMDNMVKLVAQRILNPGGFTSVLLKMIRATEYEDVCRTIKLIDTTVVN